MRNDENAQGTEIIPINIVIPDIYESSNEINIRIKLNQKMTKKMGFLENQFLDGKLKMRSDSIFDSFTRRGKYRFVKYSYEKAESAVIITMEKHFYFNVMGLKVYELANVAKNFSIMWDQYFQQIKYFLRNIESEKRQDGAELVNLDVLSITITKQFPIVGLDNKIFMRRYFLRESNFQFRTNIPFRSREEEHLFAIAYYDYEPGFEKFRIPTDEEFYQSSRLNFLDDLHTNQSLIKRFIHRFVPFHHAFILYDNKIAPQQNKYIREFYRKCVNQSYFYGMRLKKMAFYFPIKRLVKDKQDRDKQSREFDRQKVAKPTLYFYVEEEAHKYYDIEQPYQKNYFSIESYYPDICEQEASDVFSKYIAAIPRSEDDEKIFDAMPGSLRKKILVRPKNQIVFSKILAQFSFFLDRIFFRLLEFKEKKKVFNKADSALGLVDGDSITYKLPLSEQFTIMQSKFIHFYSIQIKSNCFKKNIDAGKNEVRDTYNYETEVYEIKVYRRKKASPDLGEKDHEFFSKHPTEFKALKIYLNSLLNVWNVREVFQDVIDFSSYYLNTVTDKLKDKVSLKNFGKWTVTIGGIQALIQTLTESCNTETTTIKLYITQGFEDYKQGTQSGFMTDLLDNQCVMAMTFRMYELTTCGWKQTIPACALYFKVYKTGIYLVNRRGQKLDQFKLESQKKVMELLFKEQLKKIYGNKKFIPKLYYQT